MDKSILLVANTINGIVHTTIFQDAVDKSVFVKTDKERKILKKLKKDLVTFKHKPGGFHKSSRKHLGTLKIYIKPVWRRPKQNRNNFKSVLTVRCYKHEIPSYLNYAETYNSFNSLTRDKVIKHEFKV